MKWLLRQKRSRLVGAALSGALLLAGAAVVYSTDNVEPSFWTLFLLPAFAAGYAAGLVGVTLVVATASLFNMWMFYREASAVFAYPLLDSLAASFLGSTLILTVILLAGALFALFIERFERERERVQRISLVDRLTGLRNYAYLMDRLAEERERADRRDTELALIMIDVDRFKDFNDRFGHQSGNELLKEMARLVSDCVRAEDIVARYGGEEFAIILPDTDLETAVEVAERIRKKIESHFFVGDRRNPRVRKTVSAGVAAYPAQADDEVELVDRADRALYVAKQEGRNRVVCYSDLVEERWLRRLRGIS